MLAVDDLENFLFPVVSRAKKNDEFSLKGLEDKLDEWQKTFGTSMNFLRTSVRALGINLVTGKVHGSARKLQCAIQHGAPTASKKSVKQHRLLRSCLVKVF